MIGSLRPAPRRQPIVPYSFVFGGFPGTCEWGFDLPKKPRFLSDYRPLGPGYFSRGHYVAEAVPRQSFAEFRREGIRGYAHARIGHVVELLLSERSNSNAAGGLEESLGFSVPPPLVVGADTRLIDNGNIYYLGVVGWNWRDDPSCVSNRDTAPGAPRVVCNQKLRIERYAENELIPEGTVFLVFPRKMVQKEDWRRKR